MEEIRDALLRMYRSARLARKLAKAMDDYDTPYHEIYGDLADAIYYLIGEHIEPFSESVTHCVLSSDILLEERAVSILYYIFKQNHPGQETVEQPKPNTISKEGMQKMYATNGGYMTPEGDWK